MTQGRSAKFRMSLEVQIEWIIIEDREIRQISKNHGNHRVRGLGRGYARQISFVKFKK
jgi:hypothetical protein